jgi:hypothetical protein
MKKLFSWMLFILTVIVFIFDIYVTVTGTIDVKNQMDRLAATGASGVDYWGVGADILIMFIILITVVGLILAIVSSKFAQSRVIEILSIIIFLLFIPVTLLCFFIIYL